jgi:hypothetical protein
VNAAMCDYMPDIVCECVRLKWKQFSHGIYNTRLISGLSEDEVRQMSSDKVETLRLHGGQDVAGWLAPAISATETFFDLLPEFGITYTSCPTISDPEGEQHVSLPEHSRTAH